MTQVPDLTGIPRPARFRIRIPASLAQIRSQAPGGVGDHRCGGLRATRPTWATLSSGWPRGRRQFLTPKVSSAIISWWPALQSWGSHPARSPPARMEDRFLNLGVGPGNCQRPSHRYAVVIVLAGGGRGRAAGFDIRVLSLWVWDGRGAGCGAGGW